MLRTAWMSRCQSWMRRPAARIGLVIVLGTCLWEMVGRRDRVVEHVVAGTAPEVQTTPVETSRPPVSLGVRKLPQRMVSRPVEFESDPIQADFETSPLQEPQNVHAIEFTVEVTANAPAWLTGTIEYESPEAGWQQ
jgi:hypothetical protein